MSSKRPPKINWTAGLPKPRAFLPHELPLNHDKSYAMKISLASLVDAFGNERPLRAENSTAAQMDT